MEWRILQMDTEEFDRTAGRLRESMPAGRYGVTSEQLASLRAIPHVTRRPPLNSKVQRQVVGLFAICALVISCVVVGMQFRPSYTAQARGTGFPSVRFITATGGVTPLGGTTPPRARATYVVASTHPPSDKSGMAASYVLYWNRTTVSSAELLKEAIATFGVSDITISQCSTVPTSPAVRLQYPRIDLCMNQGVLDWTYLHQKTTLLKQQIPTRTGDRLLRESRRFLGVLGIRYLGSPELSSGGFSVHIRFPLQISGGTVGPFWLFAFDSTGTLLAASGILALPAASNPKPTISARSALGVFSAALNCGSSSFISVNQGGHIHVTVSSIASGYGAFISPVRHTEVLPVWVISGVATSGDTSEPIRAEVIALSSQYGGSSSCSKLRGD